MAGVASELGSGSLRICLGYKQILTLGCGLCDVGAALGGRQNGAAELAANFAANRIPVPLAHRLKIDI